MAQAVSAAVLGAALCLAGALLATQPAQAASAPQGEFAGLEDTRPPLPPAPQADELPAESGVFDEAFFERREATPPGTVAPKPGPLAALYLQLLLVLTVGIAALIFVSGVDDAFIDGCYWLRRMRRRKHVLGPGAVAALGARPQCAFAIMVPAWKEHDVIAAMIENTVKTLDYRAFGIFCGVYRNDPATALEVDLMAARYPGRVTRVEVPHDGPTCKADCLNHIVRRVLDEERSSGTRYAGMVLHDSEDVIHPRELQLFNAMVAGADLVQLPVFSLDRTWRELTAGTYIDDFAESHGKDIAVREALTGIVPGAGVATCYSRRALEALWRSSAGEPFNTASLTEDYDLSFRLRRLGMSLTFAHVDTGAVRARGVRGKTASVIATHEYFPDKFKAAYRQRARWVIGIAFQGWQHLGWRGSAWERYFFFRDRKALVMAPAGAAAYLLLLNFALIAALAPDELHGPLAALLALPLLPQLLVVNLAFMCNRALQRAYFVGRYYGALHGLLSLARVPVNNLINFFAVMRAWRLFAVHLATGKKLAWDKTAHVYPDALTLAPARIVAFCCALLAAAPEGALAAPPLTGPAYELADEAYRALERGELADALRLSAEALQRAPGHPSLLLLQADVLVRQGRQAEALERIRGLDAADLGGPGLAQRGYLWLETGNHAAAEADFTAAMEPGGLEAEGRANVAPELAYLALRRDDDAAALKWFQIALASPRPGKSSAGLYADAGYAALRLGRNSVAAGMLSKAVDEWHAAPAAAKPFEAASLYDMRRTIDTVSRRWSATFSIGHSSTQAAAGTSLAASGSDLRVVQVGGEIAYTPERFGYRNERLFQLYASSYQAVSANDEGYATGADSRIAGLGARYKPLREHNLVLAVERRFALGARAGEDDWLLRAGWSAGRGTEWDPARDSWRAWQAYTESAYFIDAGRLVQPFEARIGRSWKLPRWHGAVVTPYLGVAGEYDDAQAPKLAAGAGPGVALRYWFGETRHRAASSYLDFSLQYRARLTDARRGGGLFGQLAVHFNF